MLSTGDTLQIQDTIAWMGKDINHANNYKNAEVSKINFIKWILKQQQQKRMLIGIKCNI